LHQLHQLHLGDRLVLPKRQLHRSDLSHSGQPGRPGQPGQSDLRTQQILLGRSGRLRQRLDRLRQSDQSDPPDLSQIDLLGRLVPLPQLVQAGLLDRLRQLQDRSGLEDRSGQLPPPPDLLRRSIQSALSHRLRRVFLERQHRLRRLRQAVPQYPEGQ
jgi:hypothetical protein